MSNLHDIMYGYVDNPEKEEEMEIAPWTNEKLLARQKNVAPEQRNGGTVPQQAANRVEDNPKPCPLCQGQGVLGVPEVDSDRECHACNGYGFA